MQRTRLWVPTTRAVSHTEWSFGGDGHVHRHGHRRRRPEPDRRLHTSVRFDVPDRDRHGDLRPGSSTLSAARKAQERAAAGDVDKACEDYIRQVRLRTPKWIPRAAADARFADATRIRQIMGC